MSIATIAAPLATAVVAATPAAPGARGAEMTDVVVTAGKVREPLQRAPMSVLVAKEAELERGGVLDFEDLPQIAPSLTISKTTQPANNSINIRGIGTYAFSIAVEPSVTVVVDDVPQAIQAAAFTSLVDVQQVEVLRGPQSTSFGRAASAGVIRVTTAPIGTAFGGRIVALHTNDRERRVQAMLSGPLTDTFGVRLATSYSDYRGSLYNVGTGRWLNGQADANVRAKLAWQPSSRWSLQLAPFWTRTDGRCCAAAETDGPDGATTVLPRPVAIAFPPACSSRVSSRRPATGASARTSMHAATRGMPGAGLRVERRGDRTTFLSLSSYEDYELVDLQDTDSTDVDFSRFQPISPAGGSANGGRLDVHAQTQEFRLEASHANVDWVGGLYWSRTRAVRDFVRGSNSLDDYSIVTPPGLVTIPVTPSALPTTNGHFIFPIRRAVEVRRCRCIRTGSLSRNAAGGTAGGACAGVAIGAATRRRSGERRGVRCSALLVADAVGTRNPDLHQRRERDGPPRRARADDPGDHGLRDVLARSQGAGLRSLQHAHAGRPGTGDRPARRTAARGRRRGEAAGAGGRSRCLGTRLEARAARRTSQSQRDRVPHGVSPTAGAEPRSAAGLRTY